MCNHFDSVVILYEVKCQVPRPNAMNHSTVLLEEEKMTMRVKLIFKYCQHLNVVL